MSESKDKKDKHCLLATELHRFIAEKREEMGLSYSDIVAGLGLITAVWGERYAFKLIEKREVEESLPISDVVKPKE